MKKVENNRFIVSVKVGPKGQITIPKQARDMFNISVGDTLMVCGDINQSNGLAIFKDDDFYKVMGK